MAGDRKDAAAAASLELLALLRADGLLAAHALDGAPVPSPLVALTLAGPRAGADPQGYAFVVEAVREGYLLHYGRPRLLAGHDPDLGLLAGDYLYALGLERIAAIGDRDAVAELADLISLSAMLETEAAGRSAIDRLWIASALAVGAGAHADHDAAKARIRRGEPAAAAAEQAASALAAAIGLSLPLAEVAEAIHSVEHSDEADVPA